MTCDILVGQTNGGEQAVFFDSVSTVAFGPVMNDLEEATAFKEWLDLDPREYTVDILMRNYDKFNKERREGLI